MTVRVRPLLGAALAALALLAVLTGRAPHAQAAETQKLLSEVGNRTLCFYYGTTDYGLTRCSDSDSRQYFVMSGYDSTDSWYRLQNVATGRCLAVLSGSLRLAACAAKGSTAEFSQSWHFSGIGPGSPLDAQVLNRSSRTCLYGSTGGSARMDRCVRYGDPGWLNHTWVRVY